MTISLTGYLEPKDPSHLIKTLRLNGCSFPENYENELFNLPQYELVKTVIASYNQMIDNGIPSKDKEKIMLSVKNNCELVIIALSCRNTINNTVSNAVSAYNALRCICCYSTSRDTGQELLVRYID